ncbi:MAG TPA: translation initiation factor [Planctomycetes bacterium]|nr:translation initiation factor [Planctomycetota bacterium]HIL38197.1 translation initiation factor [Planctomycetota bacterium]
MGRTSKDRGRRELDGPAEGLGHNPFAQLAGGKGKSELGGQAASFEQPAKPPSKTPAAQPELIIRRERKGRGGKGVVLVQGLPKDQCKSIAKAASKALGRGARVEGQEVVIQGDRADPVLDWFVGQGFRARRGN